MQSREYRAIIRTITKNSLRKHVKGLKRNIGETVAIEIAAAIHARMYGASVDNVASPIWRDHPFYGHEEGFTDTQPNKTAQEILNEGITND
jgi:hypothetical protein